MHTPHSHAQSAHAPCALILCIFSTIVTDRVFCTTMKKAHNFRRKEHNKIVTDRFLCIKIQKTRNFQCKVHNKIVIDRFLCTKMNKANVLDSLEWYFIFKKFPKNRLSPMPSPQGIAPLLTKTLINVWPSPSPVCIPECTWARVHVSACLSVG